MPVKKTVAGRIELDETKSTNNYAMQLIRDEKAEDGMVISTRHQTEGKGQRGKSWITPPGTAITMSYIMEADFLPPGAYFQLLATTAVAVRNWAARYIGEEETKIKWPNDLFWRDRKAGGILIENILRGEAWKWAVIGIGINVQQSSFPSGISNPVSFLQITGKPYEISTLTEELANTLKDAIFRLKTSGFENLLQEYNHQLWKKDSIATLQYGTAQIQGKIAGVDADGKLMVQGNEEYRFSFQEVSWVI